MAIYRGPGGAGDATTDSSTEAAAALAAAAEAEVSATSAANSATSASNSATTATTQATNASNSATAAASSASAASTSASNASTSATNAASSATTATTKASEAASSATAAASSASAASTSATNAASSASAASTSATNAASSATSAANSATTATTQATNASNSATAAASSATSAASSASTATTQATNASNSATAAATSATNAATSETNAANSATSASTSATNAANSASAASTSATNASNSASAASTSATNAASSATSAASSATAAAASYDSFDDRYLGAKAVAPTLDNDGNALLVGALYFNTVSNFMKVWDGSSWLDAYASLSGALLATNNLSDLNSVSTARTNLGLGTAALVADNTLVHLAGTETITGDKTFSSTITGSITGNAGTVTNGVYTSGSYADPTWLTSIAGSKVSGNISGNAATATTATNQSGGTVAATTGSFSSSVTLSGGTANGVAYLNGSKVLTTGSALAFSGSILTVNNIYSGLSLTDPTATYGVNFTWYNGGSNYSYGQLGLRDVTNSQTAYTYSAGASGYHNWFQNGSEQMRLTSTGLGIGTSSPDYSLCVVKASNDAWIKLQGGGSSQHSWLIGSTNSGLTYYDNTAAAYRMYLDNSGNLGLGVTPGAWGSPYKAFQVGDGSVFAASSGNIQIGENAYYDGSGYKYINTAQASRYYQSGGSHVWSTAASGTAGNAISFTQAMTLDASGNLGVGVTSPSQRLDISGYAKASGGFIAAASGIFTWPSTNWAIQSNDSSWMRFLVNAGTEAMRIDSSGNVGIGTSSPVTKLHVKKSATDALGVANGTIFAEAESLANGVGASVSFGYGSWQFSAIKGYSDGGGTYGGGLQFWTAYTNSAWGERMRIDSSGNVGIGTSSPSATLDVRNTANEQIRFGYTGTPNYCTLGRNAGTGDFKIFVNSAEPLVFGTNATERMRIDSSGNLLFNSGYGSVATAYGCRAWVDFNGTGTVAIRASGNVSSITDNGTGDYTVNFTNAMPDANYAAITSSGDTAISFNAATKNSSYATSSVSVICANNIESALIDLARINVAIFR